MTRLREVGPDDRKMKELILYLATKSEDDPRFSSTKLNKLLFYCDFTAYRRLGHSITGHSYQKLPFGPAPKAVLPILSQMQGDGDCDEIRKDYFGREQRRVQANRRSETALFSADELQLADEILQELWESSATEVSERSHGFIGWQVADFYEVIPYETVFVGDPQTPVTEDEIEFCLRLEREAE
jgi:Protein of unknown function (DUF4065)